MAKIIGIDPDVKLSGVAGVRKRRRAEEHYMQTACLTWFRYQYPKYAGLIYAIPNGGQRNRIVGAKMKAEGVLAGIPDLCLPVARQGHHALYIEMKAGNRGVVKEHQRTLMDRLNAEGNLCVVVRSKEEFIKIVNGYML